MSGGSQGTTTTVQQSDPWSKQQPYLEEVFKEAQRLYQQPGPHYYPGERVAPFSPETELALNAQAARAMSGSPYLAAAGQETLNTLGGQYLSAGNPYFGAMSGRIANELRPRLDSQFAASGRYASGAHQEAAGRALADATATLAYQNYADERANMQRAGAFAPQLAQMDYADLAQLGMPKSWNEGSVSAEFLWSSASGTGAVVWGLQAVALSDNDALDAAFGPAQEVVDTLLASGDLHRSAETPPVTIAGTPAEGDLLVFQIYRDPADVSDTLNAAAQLIGVRLFYSTGARNDA